MNSGGCSSVEFRYTSKADLQASGRPRRCGFEDLGLERVGTRRPVEHFVQQMNWVMVAIIMINYRGYNHYELLIIGDNDHE